MDLLQNTFKIDPKLLFYFPLLMHASITDIPSFENRKDFVIIGNYWHEHKCQALRYLKDSIWPILAKIVPHASLQIYGAYASQKVMQLHNPKLSFLVKGRAEDAYQIMRQARVCLAPIRFGAGLKGKLAEAMLVGTPSVTTSVGAEAMHGSLEWSGYIADEPEKFAAAAVKLYSEKVKWQKAQENGITIINQLFSTGKEETLFISRIYNLMEHLESHRLNNFFGSILMQNSANAVKYMSRWIEEKNKK
jgi:glycosyltransferase involved in cell wall biosynthesis